MKTCITLMGTLPCLTVDIAARKSATEWAFLKLVMQLRLGGERSNKRVAIRVWAGRPGEKDACGSKEAGPVTEPVACGTRERQGWTGGPMGKAESNLGRWPPSAVVACGLRYLKTAVDACGGNNGKQNLGGGFACGEEAVVVPWRGGSAERMGIRLGGRRLVTTLGRSCTLVREKLSVTA